ncbi:MAG: redoxin domain-containing protein, partial [Myxococcales bacterium]|nr:redoxin domain-containing protein [Myxococcales bacterium]
KKAASKKAAKKTTTKKVAKKAAKKTATERRKSPTARQPVVMKIGDPAPVFELDADDGQTYSLGGLAGKRIVLYFYPRDN